MIVQTANAFDGADIFAIEVMAWFAEPIFHFFDGLLLGKGPIR